MKNAEIAALACKVLLSNYRQAPIALARGSGCEIWDADGKRYIDLYAGIAVSALGHDHPRLAKAIADQAHALLHTTNLVYNEPAVRLAQKLTSLTSLTPGGEPVLTRVFFCNSGTEAIEACVKLTRRAAFVKGEPKRRRFVAFNHAFHGRSMGALALTGTPKYWEGFGADVESVDHVCYGDAAAVRAAMKKHPGEYAAIFVESVQGEGGVLPAPKGFLGEMRAVADEHGALLVCDEVQTGIGRLGSWFGFQREGVAPDAIALAKGLGGGVPIGAMLVRESLNGVLSPGTHGSTFGGNPLATAAALAVIETMESEGLVARAASLGEKLGQMLNELAKKHPTIFDGERGVGLLRGLLMHQGVEARVMLAASRERGVLLSVASEKVLRVSPPLVISEAMLKEALGAIDAAATSVEASLAQQPQLSK
jgi:acetylornithine/N-succinyldiaminopimelate aminotransferase